MSDCSSCDVFCPGPPVFDKSGDGLIDTDELCQFLDDRQSGRTTSMHINRINSKLRQDRIANKSVFAQRIKVGR